MNTENTTDYSFIDAYQGYLTDERLLLKSSSGGVTRALSNAVIKHGGVVFGVRYTEDFYHAQYYRVDCIEDIDKIIGSKYIYSDKQIIYNGDTVSVYQAVENELKMGKMVLFFGLGCDVATVKKYVSNKGADVTKLFLVDLICQGPTFPKVQESYLKRLENKYSSKVCNFSVRYKLAGWVAPPFIKVDFENGKHYYESFYGSDFGFAFSNYSRKGCYHCHFKGECHQSDMTIGDYWGIEKRDDGYNKNGVSLMLVTTDKGRELLGLVDRDEFVIRNADANNAIRNNPMYYSCREQYAEVERFKNNFSAKGLHQAVILEMGILKYYYTRLRRDITKRIRKLLK